MYDSTLIEISSFKVKIQISYTSLVTENKSARNNYIPQLLKFISLLIHRWDNNLLNKYILMGYNGHRKQSYINYSLKTFSSS